MGVDVDEEHEAGPGAAPESAEAEPASGPITADEAAELARLERQRRRLTRADLRAPRWIAAHLGIVLLVVLFAFLGRWQWHVGHRVAPLTAPQLAAWRSPQPVGSVIDPQTGLDGTREGQAGEAAGSYDATRQLLVPGRELDGRSGFYLLAPLVTGPGQAIVVNRGWIPAPAGGAEPAIPAPPAGRVEVTGWATEPESSSGTVNANGIARPGPAAAATGPHEIAVVSPAALVNLWPYHLPDGYITATDAASRSGGLAAIPAPLPPHGTSWDWLNVGYAFQWCLFAVLLVWWYVLHWRRDLRAADAEAEAAALARVTAAASVPASETAKAAASAAASGEPEPEP